MVLVVLIQGQLCLGAEPLCVKDIVVPEYPLLARLAKVQGSVRVDLQIGADGKVLSAKGRGVNRLLLEEAEKNSRQWSFVPPRTAHFPIAHAIIYVFKLEGKPVSYNPSSKVTLRLPDQVEISVNPLSPQAGAVASPARRAR